MDKKDEKRALLAFMDHVPRDRGSVWYIAPVAGMIVIGLIAMTIIAVMIGSFFE